MLCVWNRDLQLLECSDLSAPEKRELYFGEIQMPFLRRNLKIFRYGADIILGTFGQEVPLLRREDFGRYPAVEALGGIAAIASFGMFGFSLFTVLSFFCGGNRRALCSDSAPSKKEKGKGSDSLRTLPLYGGGGGHVFGRQSPGLLSWQNTWAMT